MPEIRFLEEESWDWEIDLKGAVSVETEFFLSLRVTKWIRDDNLDRTLEVAIAARFGLPLHSTVDGEVSKLVVLNSTLV